VGINPNDIEPAFGEVERQETVAASETVANFVITPGKACIWSSVEVNIVVDHLHSHDFASDELDPSVPFALTATTSRGGSRYDSRNEHESRHLAGSAVAIGYLSEQADRTSHAEIVNISDPAPTDTSTMNFQAGDVLAHQSVVTRQAGQQVCVWSTSGTALVVDSVGTIDTSVTAAVRAFEGCATWEYSTDTEIPGNFESYVAPGQPSGGCFYTVIGDAGPFTIQATAPSGWSIVLDSEPDFFTQNEFSIKWIAPPDLPIGSYPISVEVQPASGPPFTVTEIFDYELGQLPPLPTSC